MATEVAIKADIERIVSDYSLWTIGVTDSPTRRRSEHGSPPSWRQWDADTEQAARNVEAHFLAKHMKGGSGGPGRADAFESEFRRWI